MDRRFFLKAISKATAAILSLEALEAAGVDDPEKLIWEPGKKTIFLPPAPAPLVTNAGPVVLANERNYDFLAGTPVVVNNGARTSVVGLYDPSRFILTVSTPHGFAQAFMDSNEKITNARALDYMDVHKVRSPEEERRLVQSILDTPFNPARTLEHLKNRR